MEQSIKTIRYAGGFIIITGAYVLFGKVGLLFAYVQPNATAVWLPTGIAIATLLFFGYRFWPAIFLGAFITNVFTAGTIATSLGIALGNTLEAVVAVYLITRFGKGVDSFNKPIDILRFCLFGGMVATTISAVVGVTTLSLAGFSHWADYGSVWITWWMGDLSGAIIVAPFLILWFRDHRFRADTGKIFEALCLFLALFLYGGLVIKADLPYLFVFMTPILIWAAFRFGRRMVATVVFVVTEILITSLLTTSNSLFSGPINESLILVEAFMVTNFITMMMLAAIIAEERRASADLAAYGLKVTQEKVKDDVILASIGDGLVVTDQEGKITLINREAEAMFGWALKDIVGKPVDSVLVLEDAKGNPVSTKDRPLAIALSQGKSVSSVGVVTYYYVRKNKTKFPVALTATPIVFAGKIVGAIDLIKDMTLETEVDNAKNEFVSIAAHQLRTPLSTIKWNLELLIDAMDMPAAGRKRLTGIYESNERLINLVRALLNITRVENGKVQPKAEAFDVESVVDDVIKLCEHDAATKNVSFRHVSRKEPCKALADRTFFVEALKNIMDNEIVYAPERSAIGISITKVDNASCVVAITNDGPAIDDADRSNIFKKFYRGMEASRLKPAGSGLGLYISKLNMERMGGSIRFDSPVHDGKGVTFYLSLPLQKVV